jgi:hypothetical protein
MLTYSVRTSQRTQSFTIRNVNLLTLFKEIIPVFTENITEPTNKNAELLTAAGTYSIVTIQL